jgi:hypothetical protein
MEQTQSTATPDWVEHPLILSSRVIGTPVFSPDGTRLGHVDDISIEKIGGKTIYAILSFGGFLGIGERFHPVPWALLDYDLARGGFTIPLNEAELRDAPHYDAAKLRELGGPEYRAASQPIFEYYGQYGILPYW